MTSPAQIETTNIAAALIFAAAGANPAKLAQWLSDNAADHSGEAADHPARVGALVPAA